MDRTKNMTGQATEHRQAEQDELDAVVAAIYEELAIVDESMSPVDNEKGSSTNESTRSESKLRRMAQSAVGLAGGEVARRRIADARMRAKVVEVARHVAKTKTRGMTDAQVIAELAAKPGFRRSISGHLFERLDADDLSKINEIRQRFGFSGGRVLELYSEHNRTGLDGAYKGARKAGDALFAQHKLTDNEQLLKKAADKSHACVRGKTELVVGRGTKVSEETARGLKGVRQSGLSVKQGNTMVEKAADPSKVTAVGTEAAKKMTMKAGAGAAVIGAGLSVAFDVKGAINGEKTAAEVAENAAWAGGEAALTTVTTAGVTAAAAPTVAAGVTLLAGSSVAGTTAMAAGLATLGPVGIGIGTGIVVGIGVKKIRSAVRD